MVDFVPAGEDYFDYDDDESFDGFGEEVDLGDLSSFHDDVPLMHHDNDVKSNCIIDASSKNKLVLLSDLQNAVISGNLSAVKSLVGNCADRCNSILDSGWTPLTYASNFGHVKVVDALLEAGADIDLPGTDGCTAMMAACKCSRDQDVLLILKALLDKNANPLLYDKNNKTLLIYSVRSGKYDVVDLVLKYSQKVINHKDSKGWTALDWAISKSFDNIVLLLINNDANVYDINSDCISSLSDPVQDSLKALLPNSTESTEELNKESSPEKVVPQATTSIFQYSPPNQVNEIVTIDTGTSGDGYQKYGQLELLLCGLNLSHLIETFHQHDFRFEQLLCASTDDLIAIGVQQVGVRNRILTAVKDWHSAEWQEGSLPNFSSTALTFGNLQALLRTSSDHLLYISSALKYAKNQLKTYPQVLKPPACMQLDKNPDEVVIAQVEDILRSTHNLCKSLKCLHGEIVAIKVKDSDQYHQVDCINKKNESVFGRKFKIMIIALPVALGLAVFVTKYKYLR